MQQISRSVHGKTQSSERIFSDGESTMNILKLIWKFIKDQFYVGPVFVHAGKKWYVLMKPYNIYFHDGKHPIGYKSYNKAVEAWNEWCALQNAK